MRGLPQLLTEHVRRLSPAARLNRAMLLLLAAAMVWIATAQSPVRLDKDEGVNLMKARLVADGYRLYDPIWSDQPPLLTYLLAGLERVNGPSLVAARALMLAFGVLLLWSVGRLTCELAGEPAGWLAVLLLIGTRKFARLGASIMIGMPALAVGVTAVLLLHSAMRRRSIVLAAAAGATFAASMQIKLNTFIILPAVAVALATWPVGTEAERRTEVRRRHLAAAFIGGLGVVLTAIPWASGAMSLDQVLAPHLGNSLSYGGRLIAAARAIAGHLGEDGPFVVIGLAGLVYGIRLRQPAARFGGVWLISSLVTLLHASPVQSHHRIMLTTPLAIAGAAGLVDLVRSLRATGRGRAAYGATVPVGLVLALGVVRVGWFAIDMYNWRAVADMDPQVIAMLRSRGDQTRWVFTDHPLIVWEAGLRTPPEIAVLTAKRVSRSLAASELIRVLDRYAPEQAVLDRFDFPPEVDDYIARHYRRVLQTPTMELLVRADLSSTTQPTPRPTAHVPAADDDDEN
jgi:hypothetical protein